MGEMKKMRAKRGLLRGFVSLLSVLVVFVGLGLVAWALLNPQSPIMRAVIGGDTKDPAVAAESTTLELTVPKMGRVKDLPVYTAPPEDVATLDAGAMHVKGTGFPWEEGSNVYIAGHRLGYAGTKSFLVFYDLDKLKNGDEVYLTDSNGQRYTYKVFEEETVDPMQTSVMEPIPGKSIVSLQTCTLPDYSRRLIVRAELVGVSEPQA